VGERRWGAICQPLSLILIRGAVDWLTPALWWCLICLPSSLLLRQEHLVRTYAFHLSVLNIGVIASAAVVLSTAAAVVTSSLLFCIILQLLSMTRHGYTKTTIVARRSTKAISEA
jgi:hypothetical protein